jgi:hypothetical protein
MAENLYCVLFEGGSVGPASHPSATVSVDDGYKLIGGGAVIDPVEPSNFLTASYPRDPKTWYAAGKDHEIISPAFIRLYAIGANNNAQTTTSQAVFTLLMPKPASRPRRASSSVSSLVELRRCGSSS